MSPEETIGEREINSEEETDDEETLQSPTTNSKNDKRRRISHSEIERRRREKMNRYIDEIAQLLPIDAAKKLDKLTVLRVAVETIKCLQGASSKILSNGFGKQIYLNDNELLELTLATIDQMGTYFFLMIECQNGQICYASSSCETILGYKPIELHRQPVFDITYRDDIDIVKQQLNHEKKTSSTNTERLSNDSKSIPLITTRQNCLDIGSRRAFSCRLHCKIKRSNRRITTILSNNYISVDFVGYIKPYSLIDENSNDNKTRTDRRYSNINILTPSDVLHAIGTNPTSCLVAMGKLSKYIDREDIQTLDRLFLYKLNPDGQFTYFDQICYSLFGYPIQDLLGTHLNSFIHEEDQSRVTDVWNRVCRDHQIGTTVNYRFRTNDNTYIVLQTIFEPFINPWNDELEMIIARNKIKVKHTRLYTSTNIKNENPRRIDSELLSAIDPTELLRQLLS